jgi:hypothetical protein
MTLALGEGGVIGKIIQKRIAQGVVAPWLTNPTAEKSRNIY